MLKRDVTQTRKTWFSKWWEKTCGEWEKHSICNQVVWI